MGQRVISSSSPCPTGNLDIIRSSSALCYSRADSSYVLNCGKEKGKFYRTDQSVTIKDGARIAHSIIFPLLERMPRVCDASNAVSCSSINMKSKSKISKVNFVSSALPETAASIAIAATVVGAAAMLLSKRTKAAEVAAIPSKLKLCEDCGGSGVCSECNGEGFVLKKLSEDRAEKARLSAKNMATRYTAGLPKKWSYCTKCSSGRSCSTCGGRGKLEQ